MATATACILGGAAAIGALLWRDANIGQQVDRDIPRLEAMRNGIKTCLLTASVDHGMSLWSEKDTTDAMLDMTTRFIEQRKRYRERWFPFRVISAPAPACHEVDYTTAMLVQVCDADYSDALIETMTTHCPGTWMDVLMDKKN